jgi:hypothetical protein
MSMTEHVKYVMLQHKCKQQYDWRLKGYIECAVTTSTMYKKIVPRNIPRQ